MLIIYAQFTALLHRRVNEDDRTFTDKKENIRLNFSIFLSFAKQWEQN